MVLQSIFKLFFSSERIKVSSCLCLTCVNTVANSFCEEMVKGCNGSRAAHMNRFSHGTVSKLFC